MNTNVITGIVVAIALLVLGWWYWAFMMPQPVPQVNETPTPDESVNSVAMDNAAFGASLSGTWRSNDDAQFTREFTAGGTIIDRYEGSPEATSQGEWSLVTDPSAEKVELPVVKDAKIVRVQFPEEALYFAVNGLTETNLSMIYLNGARAGNLEFTRIK